MSIFRQLQIQSSRLRTYRSVFSLSLPRKAFSLGLACVALFSIGFIPSVAFAFTGQGTNSVLGGAVSSGIGTIFQTVGTSTGEIVTSVQLYMNWNGSGATTSSIFLRGYSGDPYAGGLVLTAGSTSDPIPLVVGDHLYTFTFPTSVHTLVGAQYGIGLLYDNTGGTLKIFGTDSTGAWFGRCYNPFSSICSGLTQAYYGFDSTTPPPIDYRTRIVSFTPLDGATVGTPTTFTLQTYINPNDIGTFVHIEIILHNIDQNVLLLGALSPSDIYLYDANATTSGFFNFSTTTSIGQGNYRLEAILRPNIAGVSGVSFFGYDVNLVGNEITEDHQFTVGAGTFIGGISQSSYSQYGSLLGTLPATSTTALAKTCYPFSGQFDTTQCIAFLFVPDGGLVHDTMTNFRDNVSTHFPLGYFTDFVRILNSTSTASLVLFSFNVPDVLPGGGTHFEANLTGAFDSMLNATTGPFISSGASDTRTFFQITDDYWIKILYLLAFIYMLRRIIGSRFAGESNFNDFTVRKNTKPIHISEAEMARAKRSLRRNGVDRNQNL